MPTCAIHEDEELVSMCCGAPINESGFCAKCRDRSGPGMCNPCEDAKESR